MENPLGALRDGTAEVPISILGKPKLLKAFINAWVLEMLNLVH